MNKPLYYDQSLTLLTDLYQITMAYGYWKAGMADKEAVFHMFFRKNPFKGGFAVACGLAYVTDILTNFAFDKADLEYLASLKGNNGKPLFEKSFLDYLFKTPFACDVDAIPEGTVVFPHEPLIRVKGPIVQAQILETILLNIMNFQTLIATKAARVAIAAGDQPVLEFGLRRAQGIDGSLAASRAAYIGGCSATSNVLAGKMFGIPVKGTHAHSWVMAFPDELTAFREYAKAMPNNCVFLVDTYDTIKGVKNAIIVGNELRAKGFEMAGIRLDSGDLAYLSIEARKLLDDAGFPEAKIVASNDIDENILESMKRQGAKIDIWGIGTKMITAYDQPALGGVYKLSAIRDKGQEWQYKLKLSEQSIKISNPGILQVRRYSDGIENEGDAIYDLDHEPKEGCRIISPVDAIRRKALAPELHHDDLLIPVFAAGKCVYAPPDVHAARKRTQKQLAAFHPGIKRFANPHEYPVGLEETLHNIKISMIEKVKEKEEGHGLQL
jgi:nicotinate phosphoribosyltransferase